MTDTEVDLIDDVVDAAAGRGDNMVVAELVTLVQRHDPLAIESNGFGVSEGRLLAYAEAIPDDGSKVSPDDVRTALSERTVDSESWVGGDTLYRTDDDRVSLFPRSWHEALEGEDDLVRYAEVILADVGDSEEAFGHGGPGVGIPEDELLKAATVLGPFTWDDAEQELERLGSEGAFEEDVDQHPDARVRLAGVDHD